MYSTSLMIGFHDLGYKVDWYGGKRELWWKFPLRPQDMGFTCYDELTDWENLEDCDYIIIDGGGFIGDNDPVTEAYFAKIGEKIRLSGSACKTAIVDFRDHSGRGYDPAEFAPIPRAVTARRETSLQEFPHLFPLDGHAYQSSWNQHLRRDIFVSCMFGHNTGNLRYGYNLRPFIARGIADTYPGAPVLLGEQNRIPYSDYMSLLNRSLISISCWGGGYSCYRDWEILSSGAILAYKRMPNPHLDMYKDMESCIEYDDRDELLDKLDFLVGSTDKVSSMLAESLKVSHKHNLPMHKAQSLIAEIKSKKKLTV